MADLVSRLLARGCLQGLAPADGRLASLGGEGREGLSARFLALPLPLLAPLGRDRLGARVFLGWERGEWSALPLGWERRRRARSVLGGRERKQATRLPGSSAGQWRLGSRVFLVRGGREGPFPHGSPRPDGLLVLLGQALVGRRGSGRSFAGVGHLRERPGPPLGG